VSGRGGTRSFFVPLIAYRSFSKSISPRPAVLAEKMTIREWFSPSH